MKLNQRERRQVLVIGHGVSPACFLIPLLSRAKYTIDMITHSSLLKSHHAVNDYHIVPTEKSLVTKAIEKELEKYDWIIITDDVILSEILHSSLPIDIKIKLLPVLKEKNFSHLYSKIGLSKTFSSHNVQTPPYEVVCDVKSACEAAERLGYPVVLKIDASGGGGGVYACHSSQDIKAVDPLVWMHPMLIQKKIKGEELDLSALYLDGELIHFSYSKIRNVISKFGPSCVRTYHSLSHVKEQVFNELKQIGIALGANGFTNTSCIEADDGSGRYYIEVDMRPNVWVDTPLFIGEDVAERITQWFLNKQSLKYPVKASEGCPSEITIPFFLRLRWFELLINRYGVWKFIPQGNKTLIAKLLLKKLWVFAPGSTLKKIFKNITPKKYHKMLKQLVRGILQENF